MPQPYNVFTIYAREDAQYLDELRGQLRPLEIAGRIRVWSDREINPGVEWEKEIVAKLDTADIILILVSAAYYNSVYIHEVEITYAIQRHERGEAKVLPIIVRPCAFGDDPIISRLQVLPTDGKPVNDRRYWHDHDDAWLDVVKGLKYTIELMISAEGQSTTSATEHHQKQNDSGHEQPAWQQSPPLPLRRYAAFGGIVLAVMLAVWLGARMFGDGATNWEGIPIGDRDTLTNRGALTESRPLADTSKSGFDMVLVRGGTFEMGDQFGDGDSDEKPEHMVRVDDFYMGKTEVTFDEYDAFCVATKRDAPSDLGWGRGKHPVINVSWNDAVAYCNWLSERQRLQKVYTINGDRVTADWSANGYRLPTEAEWEYAARSGGKQEKYAGLRYAEQLYRYSNFCDENCTLSWKIETQNDGYRYTAPVSSFLPNGIGLYDMSGNVWEWCWDPYDFYLTMPISVNPRGTNSGGIRVLRGGSWSNAPALIRVSDRGYDAPSNRNDLLGFRLAVSLQ